MENTSFDWTGDSDAKRTFTKKQTFEVTNRDFDTWHIENPDCAIHSCWVYKNEVEVANRKPIILLR